MSSQLREVTTQPIITSIIPINEGLIINYDPPINDGASQIVGYKFSVDNGYTYPFTTSTTSSFTINDLINGTTYQVIMLAVNVDGYSPASNMVEATPSN
jgi:hypothetical protein